MIFVLERKCIKFKLFDVLTGRAGGFLSTKKFKCCLNEKGLFQLCSCNYKILPEVFSKLTLKAGGVYMTVSNIYDTAFFVKTVNTL